MLKDRKGFTLIELVMVIVILAILAAVAIPRFIDLQSEARTSTARGIGGAIAGAANILHSQYVLRVTPYYIGTTASTPDTAVIGNANISGATIAIAAPDLTVGSNSSSLITITVGNQPHTMTMTITTNGPRFQYNF